MGFEACILPVQGAEAADWEKEGKELSPTNKQGKDPNSRIWASPDTAPTASTHSTAPCKVKRQPLSLSQSSCRKSKTCGLR